MRPIRLEISGFGPYSRLTSLNLEALGEKGLYLITGDTGAGKTTIFDAITYALYGSASGENRDDDSMLRSKYATIDTPTYVELEFDYAGKRYKVSRNPSYVRQAKRGGGLAQQPANAVFTYPDGKVVSGKRDVDAAVADVIGLSEKQFKQIAMIAQGDFMKLITEDTSQRREILRHIFKTRNYQSLQESLREESSNLKSECDKRREGLKQYVSGISCDEDDEYFAEVEKLKAEIPPVEFIKEIVTKLITRDNAQVEIFTRESEIIDQKLGEVNGRISKAEEKNKMLLEKERTARQLDDISQRGKLLSERLEKEKERQNELEKLREDIAALEAEMPLYAKASEQESQITEVRKELSTLNELFEKSIKEKEKCEKRRAELKKEYADLETTVESTAKLTSEREELVRRASELYTLAKLIGDYEGGSHSLREKIAEYKEYQAEHDSLVKKCEALTGEVYAMKKRRSEIEGVDAEKEKLLHSQEITSKRYTELKKLSADIIEWEKRRSEQEEATDLYREAAESVFMLSEEYERSYRAFLDDRAGVLAESLKDGAPCPVCGSIQHPSPAKKQVGAPTESELEGLKAKLEKARNVAEKKSTEASAMKAKADELEKTLNARLAELLECCLDKGSELCEKALESCTSELNILSKKLTEAEKLIAEKKRLDRKIESLEKQEVGTMTAVSDSDKTLAELRSRCDNAEGMLKQLRADAEKGVEAALGDCLMENAREKIVSERVALKARMAGVEAQLAAENERTSRKAELEKLIPELENEITELNEALTNNTVQKAASESRLSEMTDRFMELRSGLRFESGENARIYVLSLKKRCTEIRNAYEAAEKAVNESEKERSALSGKYDQLKLHIDDLSDIDGEKELAERSRLTAEKTQLAAKLRQLHTRVTVNSTALENILNGSSDLSELESRYSWVKNLSDTANGKLSEQSKFMLETYIQTAYFDRIIQRANQRLIVMSDGQYSLTRRTEYDDKRTQVGLDLDVIDHYNGSVRSVKTLSGGESFKASLSLALGLSDEIQCSAGGIQLDTMFVDEGFGSLDENSIEQAMRALAGLSDGHRLVGIISHVQALKQRIDKQIVVTKVKNGGSHAEIIV
ncbi:AAA family ATPase [Ruminococcus sp.]|uniref:AAA family ATPase n=1 Tax=Ruminococcus sp. TaxID=41978 RepID=UPI0025FCECEF|nr:AAA family ATPase [Ruminococcus sp.]